MTYPIIVERGEQGYTATVPFLPGICVTAPTREAALASAQSQLEDRLTRVEVVMIEPAEDPWMSIAGKYADDDRLREIAAEAYAARDAELVK